MQPTCQTFHYIEIKTETLVIAGTGNVKQIETQINGITHVECMCKRSTVKIETVNFLIVNIFETILFTFYYKTLKEKHDL